MKKSILWRNMFIWWHHMFSFHFISNVGKFFNFCYSISYSVDIFLSTRDVVKKWHISVVSKQGQYIIQDLWDMLPANMHMSSSFFSCTGDGVKKGSHNSQRQTNRDGVSEWYLILLSIHLIFQILDYFLAVTCPNKTVSETSTTARRTLCGSVCISCRISNFSYIEIRLRQKAHS